MIGPLRRHAIVVCLLLPAIGHAAPAQPPAIAGLYEELRIAIETEDVDALMAQFAPLMRLEASLRGGWVNELSTMFHQRDSVAAELRFDEVQVVGQKAFVLVTWAFSGKSAGTGEAWSETVQRADLLTQKGAGWQVFASDRVDQEALKAKVTDGQFVDPDSGLEVTAPPNWRVLPMAGARACVAAFSPDLNASLTWLVSDLPGTFTTEQLARAQQDAMEKLAPTLGIEFRDVESGTDTLAGRPAYRVSRTIVAQDGSEVYSDLTFCVVGSTVYLCARTAMPPASYATYQDALNRAVAAAKIVEVEAPELPPEAGRLEGRRYINDVQGCEITAPQGWTAKIGQGQFELQVTMYEPGGESSLMLGMIPLPAPEVTAEKAITGEDNLTSQVFEDFKLVKRGETKVGDLPAYESISTFTFAGQKRQRHRVYLVDNDRLFFMFADAVPADKWTRLAPIFSETFQSFKLIEATAG